MAKALSQLARYEFLCQRDGEDSARRFLIENVVKTYRKTVLTHRGLMKRRRLIEAYCEAKRILAESQACLS